MLHYYTLYFIHMAIKKTHQRPTHGNSKLRAILSLKLSSHDTHTFALWHGIAYARPECLFIFLVLCVSVFMLHLHFTSFDPSKCKIPNSDAFAMEHTLNSPHARKSSIYLHARVPIYNAFNVFTVIFLNNGFVMLLKCLSHFTLSLSIK